MPTNRLLEKEKVSTYASVLLDSAFEAGGQDAVLEVRDQAEQILRIMRSSIDLSSALEDSSYTPEQRSALARAILKDAPIVVLDEATAFADPENEALIQRALGVLCAGKTVLMIAHRLSTVAGADAIYVLDGGRLAEQGTHAELVEAGGLYARMWADYRTSAQWRIGKEGGYAA